MINEMHVIYECSHQNLALSNSRRARHIGRTGGRGICLQSMQGARSSDCSERVCTHSMSVECFLEVITRSAQSSLSVQVYTKRGPLNDTA